MYKKDQQDRLDEHVHRLSLCMLLLPCKYINTLNLLLIKISALRVSLFKNIFLTAILNAQFYCVRWSIQKEFDLLPLNAHGMLLSCWVIIMDMDKRMSASLDPVVLLPLLIKDKKMLSVSYISIV